MYGWSVDGNGVHRLRLTLPLEDEVWTVCTLAVNANQDGAWLATYAHLPASAELVAVAGASADIARANAMRTIVSVVRDMRNVFDF